MIEYRDSALEFPDEAFEGFCDGWPNPLSGAKLRKVLVSSHSCVLAVEGGVVVGFVNAISDGILSAFIPLLEVRPGSQGKGIGKELVSRLVAKYRNLYMIDLVCDVELVKFYEPLGFRTCTGMAIRNYTTLKSS